MSIENQIAINADEQECDYCPVCEMTMTYSFCAGVDFLECDNQECLHIIEGE